LERLPLVAEHHIDDYVEGAALEIGAVVRQAVAVAQDPFDRGGQFGPGVAAVEQGDPVTIRQEIAKDVRSQKAAAANDQDFQGRPPRSEKPRTPPEACRKAATLRGVRGLEIIGPPLRYTWKELPQPQVDFTWGLLNLKPAPSSVST